MIITGKYYTSVSSNIRNIEISGELKVFTPLELLEIKKECINFFLAYPFLSLSLAENDEIDISDNEEILTFLEQKGFEKVTNLIM